MDVEDMFNTLPGAHALFHAPFPHIFNLIPSYLAANGFISNITAMQPNILISYPCDPQLGEESSPKSPMTNN